MYVAKKTTNNDLNQNFSTSVFSHEHLYVGFLLCGHLDKVFVNAEQKEFDNIRHLLDDGKMYTRNVVYVNIFLYSRGIN